MLVRKGIPSLPLSGQVRATKTFLVLHSRTEGSVSAKSCQVSKIELLSVVVDEWISEPILLVTVF